MFNQTKDAAVAATSLADASGGSSPAAQVSLIMLVNRAAPPASAALPEIVCANVADTVPNNTTEPNVTAFCEKNSSRMPSNENTLQKAVRASPMGSGGTVQAERREGP